MVSYVQKSYFPPVNYSVFTGFHQWIKISFHWLFETELKQDFPTMNLEIETDEKATNEEALQIAYSDMVKT